MFVSDARPRKGESETCEGGDRDRDRDREREVGDLDLDLDLDREREIDRPVLAGQPVSAAVLPGVALAAGTGTGTGTGAAFCSCPGGGVRRRMNPTRVVWGGPWSPRR